MATQVTQDNKDIKVFVATSGGVDSSLAITLLRDEGYDVTGVYFKTYKPDGNREYCRKQGMDAQAVCKHLGVPFKVFELEDEYRQKVFDYMIAGYKAGRTPNPDILCNKEIKFGVFAQKAFESGADYIATGHYVRKQIRNDQGEAALLKGLDDNKDQSYFLSQISQEVLQQSLFPIGELQKSKVRELAKDYGLHTAEKKDSQGICFIGQEIDVKEFLKRYIPEESGDVLNISGEVIGAHQGARFSTIGERHGFTINPKHQTPEMPRLFVVERDVPANTITVGTLEELRARQKAQKSLRIAEVSWINDAPEEGVEYECRIRHRGELIACTVVKEGEDIWQVHFTDAPYAPALGQFLAIYAGERCLGGGVMV